ncbi:alpha/beta hydrolase family protein [Ulvibacterium sp.]|uniref:alpha/beta hydrolase family protein n=1 Tax=Ulvibacterium sp. TaxID=2665914 RepID=UPI003BA8F7D3
MIPRFFILFMICSPILCLGQMVTKDFKFKFENRQYSGILDLPENRRAISLVVLVPGSGRTNIVEENWNHELRKRLTEMGIACYSYDKAGCGMSEGEFDYNQSVENSSKEVLAAIQGLREAKIPGSNNLGLWGISRGGWICPLAIEQDTSIAFWISVSGPNHLENMVHLLKTNWLIEGRSKEDTEMLAEEWLEGYRIAFENGSFEAFLEARENFNKDPFVQFLNGGKAPTEEGFNDFREYLSESNIELDPGTGLGIVLPEFDTLLKKIECPVLAIWGKKDSQVDWKASKGLYWETIGATGKLTTKTFADCNHLMQTCEDCGMKESYEDLVAKGLGQPCEGYYEAIETWLLENGFGDN